MKSHWSIKVAKILVYEGKIMKSYWQIEVAKILVFVALGAAVVMLMGCETTPKYIDDCEEIFIVEQEINDCKDRVVEKEDRIVKKQQREATEEALSRRCWQVERGVWDKRTGSCKSWNML